MGKDRCDLDFDKRTTMSETIIVLILSFASQVMHNLSLLNKPISLKKSEQLIAWSPRDGTWKLNTDGSVIQSDLRAARGGLLRDCLGRVLGGFSSFFGLCNPVRAKLWGVLKSLCLASSLLPYPANDCGRI